jgi:voltage-gated potassium channel
MYMPERETFDHFVLRLARWLRGSRQYGAFKSFVRALLNDPENPGKKYVDLTIIFLIISSVAILIYEVKNPIPRWLEYYDIYFVSLVFLLEYLMRLWVSSDMSVEIIEEYDEATFIGREFRVWPALAKGMYKKLSFIVTPSAMIDLLAIFPAYRPLRVLRIFILFRFLKLLRYTRSINQFVDVLANKRFELLTLLFLLIFVVFTGGIAIYVLEETHNPRITTLFDGLYWSLVTISTVGYGDISPVTGGGRVISMMIIIFGIAMISFATSVIVSAFSEKLHALKEERVVEEVNKSREFLIICGYGQMTKMFLRQAELHPYTYIILDKDQAKVQEAIHDGYDAIVDDASRYTTLRRFNTDNAGVTLLCMSNDDVENIYITLNAKGINPRIRVVARAGNRSAVSKYERAGADHILLPNEMASTMMVVAVLRPVMYKAIHAIFTGQNMALLDEVKIYKYSSLKGISIGEIPFRDFKLVLIGVHRAESDSFVFNPERELLLEVGDVLLVMGHRMSISYFRDSSCVERNRCLK